MEYGIFLVIIAFSSFIVALLSLIVQIIIAITKKNKTQTNDYHSSG